MRLISVSDPRETLQAVCEVDRLTASIIQEVPLCRNLCGTNLYNIQSNAKHYRCRNTILLRRSMKPGLLVTHRLTSNRPTTGFELDFPSSPDWL
jgi:hypothetical protein